MNTVAETSREIDCAHCGERFIHQRVSGPWRKFCSERCKANAADAKRAAGRAARRCKCGSTEVSATNKPVCPDCRKDGRDAHDSIDRLESARKYLLSTSQYSVPLQVVR